MNIIYLDNNSTTPVDSRVMEVMLPYFTDDFANANSTHRFGVGAFEAVKNARAQVAELLGADSSEIVFTSGATEAINLSIKGVAEQFSTKGKHFVTVTTEHTAVLDVCNYLENRGYEMTYLPVRPDGLLDMEELSAALRNDTILVSVMLANNETGVIQSVREIAEAAHAVGALCMTDATQAAGKIPVNVDELGVDLLCLSGHKFYAPKGVGALFVRRRGNRVKLPALLHGGGHENGLRSGTLNVPGIAGLGKAAEIAAKEMAENEKHIRILRDYLEKELLGIEHTTVNGSTEHRLYNTTNICFHGADSDAIIMGLSNPESDAPMIAVSNGSACTSARIEPSHVLTAMGLDENAAFNSIRFSVGKFNTKEEIEMVIDAVKKVVAGLREMSN